MFSFVAILLAVGAAADPEAQQDTMLTSEEAASVEEQKAERVVYFRGKKYAPEDMVCIREKVTGTRVKKKICSTAAEWEMRREEGQLLGQELQRGAFEDQNAQ